MKFTKIFHADLENIHHAALWLGFFGISADILGLFRDRFLAGMFGASRSLDIYYAAFRVPDFIYTFMLLFTASTAIIPIFLDKDLAQTAFLARIMLLSPIFLGLSNIFSSVTQAFRRFFVYGLAPVFYNVGVILGITVFYRFMGLAGLAWGVVLGAFLHMA